VNDGGIRSRILPDEILTEILIPDTTRNYAGHYEKFRLRGSVDYPLAGVAVSARKANGKVEDLRIALTAVNPLPLLLSGDLAAIAA
ncbi:MAG TPA: 4-hydroxybenzoyl-CoA reductase subunit beta, partial [Acidobacteriota bacterium]|nr:4-hydroxybenzoyl-CoA reductase subunit beta [Acidobacteriota bacterium]